MAALLERKMAEGVEVRVIVDGFGSRPYGQAGRCSRASPPPARRSSSTTCFPLDRDGLYPDDQHVDWRQDEVGRADHRKLYVIDGTVAWTGGAGIEDHFENGGFHDVMVRVTGDVVRQAQAAFLTSFRGHGGPLPTDLSRLLPGASRPRHDADRARAGHPRWIRRRLAGDPRADRRRRERLDVMNPYLTDADMIQRIVAAARRGVKVRVVVSKTSNNAQATAALKHHYPDLIDAGVEVWEFPGTVVHAKVVVADDVVSFGTVNLDAWALYRNSEIMMIARSADVAALIEERLFEPDIARSAPGEPPSGTHESFEGWFWNKLSRLL